MNLTLQLVLALALMGTLALMAGIPAIGLVQATGEFRLNHAATYGNGTLFEGAVLETSAARSDVSFSSGGHMAVAPNSRTRIYKDHAVLESGAADIAASGYKLIASTLSISGPGARVALDSSSRIRVGAMSSPVEVRNSSDVLLARVTPGHPLEFDTEAGGGQGGASGPVTISGTLVKNGDQYTITDDTTNVTYQVTGKDLDKKVGKKVKAAGAVVSGTGTGAVPVIAITTITVIGAAAIAGGLGAAAIAGIVIGGATGVGLGVAAATGAFSSTSP